MKKITNKFLKLQPKLVLLFSSLAFLSCGPFSSYNYNNSDGIYGSDTQNTSNQNGLYYKNYFDQKAQQLGVTNNPNDSILTDIDSYSSAYVDTNIEYKKSNGSWGDNPGSINFINNSFYPDHAFYWSSFHRPYYMGSWYSPYYYPYTALFIHGIIFLMADMDTEILCIDPGFTVIITDTHMAIIIIMVISYMIPTLLHL